LAYELHKAYENYKRKGLKALLERASEGNKFTVVVTHKDRIARFGVELIEYFLTLHGCKLLVLNDDVQKSDPQRELTEDLLAIIRIFSYRLYGQRRDSGRKVQEDSSVPDHGAKENLEQLVWSLKAGIQQHD
jgi:putative resolvase